MKLRAATAVERICCDWSKRPSYETVFLPTAIVEGDISPIKLCMHEGAIFEGRCMMLHDFMNAEELSRYLEVEMKSVLDWATAGKLPASKDQDSWKFERKAIDAWIASGEIGK